MNGPVPTIPGQTKQGVPQLRTPCPEFNYFLALCRMMFPPSHEVDRRCYDQGDNGQNEAN
jgi:hypothetical protein